MKTSNNESFLKDERRSISLASPTLSLSQATEAYKQLEKENVYLYKNSFSGTSSYEPNDRSKLAKIIEIEDNNSVIKNNVNIAKKKLSVDGSVIEIGEEEVLLEIYTKQKTMEISLPKTNFPEDIYYGMPVILSLEEKNGTKRYDITKGKVKNLSKSEMQFLDSINL